MDVYYDALAPVPAFLIGWKIPARRTKDFYALQLASDLLFSGDSSRLYQKLVKGDESVVQMQGGVDERRGPSAIYVFAIPKPGEDVALIRQLIMDEIKDLATAGPSLEEMEKLHNNLLNDAVRSRQSSLFRAQRLAEYALYDNDPHLINTELDEYLGVTADEIKEAVARYMNTDNRATLDIVPSNESVAETVSASVTTATAGEPAQPGAPAPQVPPAPPIQPPPPSDQPTDQLRSSEPPQPADPAAIK
jgi:predicted Zn-dependent peptidase